MNKSAKKAIGLIIFLAIFAWGIRDGYSRFGSILYQPKSMVFYDYKPVEIGEIRHFDQNDKAIGIPILMYHGVVNHQDSENTLLDNFVKTMERLKKEGYQSVSIDELVQFHQGKIDLPARPIIITFDDGRKDSYYPVDKVLEKLGFKATIFVATNRANRNDPFYLTWGELKKMHESGRWNIQAHGRDSHNTIQISETGEMGKFMNSREYIKGKGLETVEEFEKRVEGDYQNGIADIETHLGYRPEYFSIPLNDYDAKDVPNYQGSYAFNESMVRKYFKVAFIETVVGYVNQGHGPVYNLTTTDMSRAVRIEPRNMPVDTLFKLLDEERPVATRLNLSNVEGWGQYKEIFGTAVNDEKGLVIMSDKESNLGMITWGKEYWSDYTLTGEMQKNKGRSAGIVAYQLDHNNYVTMGMTDNSLFLREVVGGKSRDLRPAVLVEANKFTSNKYRLSLVGNTVDGYFNGKLVFRKVKVQSTQGKVGIRIWDPIEAKTTVKSLNVATE